MQQIERRWPEAKVILLADLAVCQDLIGLMNRIDGLLLKNQGAESLLKTVDLILLGQRLFPAAALGATRTGAEDVLSPERCSTLRRLSERECQVLDQLAEGSSNKVIARRLGITEATVKVHVKAILRKINAKNRTQAALRAPSMLGRLPVVRIPERRPAAYERNRLPDEL